ncbi:MAG: PKD domain-containing protein, partial [Bacteroidia bacterium]|nr:PKD domain-containing protein [Bacteroidia bacterium]
GGGGEGGEGGGAGGGGGGGGGCFGIFVWDNGTGGSIRDCYVSVQPPGIGGQKGLGKPGGLGGAGGAGGFDCGNPDCAAGCEGGRGGNGAQGQNGGAGGNGGKGADGQSAPFYQNLSSNPLSPSISTQFLPTPAVSVQSTGCYNSEILFSIVDPSPSSVYTWTWADGSSVPLTATGTSASFVFVSGGYKTLILTRDGIPYQYTDFLDLDFRCPVPQILNVPTSGAVCAGDVQIFSAGADDPSPILEQRWTVTGPGNYMLQSEAPTLSFPPANQNLELGTYKISLKVRTGCGGWSVDTSVSLQVLPRRTIDVSLLSLSERTGCAPLNASLLATTLNAGEGATLTWKKRAANGAITILGTFPLVGASQTYEGPVNDGDVIFVELNSAYPCPAVGSEFVSNEYDYDVYPRPTVACPGTQLTQALTGQTVLTGSVSGGTPPYTYTWNLGNGTTLSGESSGTTVRDTVRFGGSGIYNVTLSVTDANGCNAGPCDNPIVVTVTEIPPTYAADFSAVPREGCGSLTATFSAVVSEHFPNPQFVWEFGDGSQRITDVPTVVHQYGQAGAYTVVLTVRNAQGLSLEPIVKTAYIVVSPPPSVRIGVFGE